MSTFLDARTSQNISYSDGLSIPLSSTPALFAELGLVTTGAGPNLRIQFTASVAVSSLASVAVPIRIDIYRGRLADPERVLVYSAIETTAVAGILGVASRKILTVTGSEYTPPNPGLLVYQAFISIPGGVPIAPTRTGPESFNAAAYSD
ncbi:hypothetical protein OH784_06215 [Ectobacillus funiculus]|uniref:hypothetical protein n=1 Tax=Ectobacillus funiculus TaxID=137993 RepID=UPI00397B803C